MAETLIALTPSEFDQLKTNLRQEVREGFIELKNLVVEKALTYKEAAEYLSIGTEALRRRIKSGAVPKRYIHKNGGTLYFFASELNQLIKNS